MKRRNGTTRAFALLAALAVMAAACSGSDDADTDSEDSTPVSEAPTETDPPPDTAPPETDAPPNTDAPAPTEAPVETDPPLEPVEDRAYYILPPGNYGGLPTNDNSLDQLPLYDALTPLRGDVTDADLDAYFLPQDFEPMIYGAIYQG